MPSLIWRGDAFRTEVLGRVATRLEHAGAFGVQVARERAPVRTGRTRASISAVVERSAMTLQIRADVRWAVFIELGTRRMPARPFLRPALDAVGKAFRGG